MAIGFPATSLALIGCDPGQTVVDTTAAKYVWEWAGFPQYYIPLADVRPDVLVDEDHVQELKRGKARRHGVRAWRSAGTANASA